MAHDNAQLACEIPLDLMFQLDESGGCSAAENPKFHNIHKSSYQALWDSLFDDMA